MDVNEAMREPNAATMREILGHYATGVAVVTSRVGPNPSGFAVNSFTSVSLDPPPRRPAFQ